MVVEENQELRTIRWFVMILLLRISTFVEFVYTFVG